MAKAFRRTRDGVECRLDAGEAALLTRLVEMVVGMLDEREQPADRAGEDPLEALVGMGSQRTRPEDPALARLLPDAYADDAAAAEWRRFTEAELRAGKIAAARAVLDSLRPGRMTLGEEAAHGWLTALTDVRLVVGERLGVSDTEAWAPPPGDPRSGLADVYDWLTWLQETLVRAVAGD